MTWESVSFLDAARDVSSGNTKIPKSEYAPAGELAVVDQGQGLIAGYVDDTAAAHGSAPPVIVFGDHTRSLKFVDFPFAMGADGVKVLAPREGFDAKYLYWYLTSVRIPNAGYSRHFKFLKDIKVVRPPLAEQRRIAAALDRVDALRAQRRRAVELLDDLAQSVFLDMFGDPVTNPRGLTQVPLTEACAPYSGGTPSKANPANWEGDVPWFSAKDLKQPDLFRSADTISAEVPRTTTLKLLPADTVAIVVRGMILAHSFPVCVLRVPSTINQDLKALLPRTGLDAQFLAHCLRAQKSHALKQVSQAAHGTTRLDAQGLARIKVLLPEPERQREFARRVAATRALRADHETHLADLDELFASIQQRAFAGQLWERTDA
ncbi:restriction endonuclease subunit S [Streptomyces cinnabarinus]|uniref:Restriction endonuclease subunit S n=1 Tax=Streptomyces cinnabarinus TaxID=67287 RepID=A0ABY7KFP7_9ACTN|nr:restriction endonuclease subunit S [Streptomyces cinnabarinus]WAZ22495.1 restriction endonuclease subunit S [Streptomyces cinnabarinus]